MDAPTAFDLSRLPFLHGMDWRHLEAMAACALPARFEENETLFNAGETANRFYILLSGRIVLETDGPSGRPVEIQVIEAGDVVGWSWLFPPYQWRFSARTLGPVEAVFFAGPQLREVADADPAFCCALWKRMSGVMLSRLQATRARLASM